MKSKEHDMIVQNLFMVPKLVESLLMIQFYEFNFIKNKWLSKNISQSLHQFKAQIDEIYNSNNTSEKLLGYLEQ